MSNAAGRLSTMRREKWRVDARDLGEEKGNREMRRSCEENMEKENNFF